MTGHVDGALPEQLRGKVEAIRATAVEVVTACDELLNLPSTWATTPPTYLTAVLTPDEVRARLRPDQGHDHV